MRSTPQNGSEAFGRREKKGKPQHSSYSDPAVERALLGECLIDPTLIPDVGALIQARHFTVGAHKLLWRTLWNLSSELGDFDVPMVTAGLGDKGISRVGGPEYILSCMASCSNVSFAQRHARVLLELSTLRDVERGCEEIAERLKEAKPGINGSLADLASDFEAKVFELTEDTNKASNHREPASSVADRVVMDLGKGAEEGALTGYKDLDELIFGFRPGELSILAARPAKGKTAVGMCLAMGVSSQNPGNVLLASLEMPKENLCARMLCSAGQVDSNCIRSGVLSDAEFDRVEEARERIHGLSITIVDRRRMSVNQLRAIVRREQQQADVPLVIVDYLQLMHEPDVKDRREEVGAISRGLKGLARDLGVPVLALAQLNRDIEKRRDPEPMLSDLKESGDIEQDADHVFFLWRDEELENWVDGKLNMTCAKNRHGKTGRIFFNYKPRFFRISAWGVL